jgi:polyphenol oxidase
LRPRVEVTTRAGGVSVAPYDGANLAAHVGDDPQAVAANRRHLLAALGVRRIVFMHQVHGREVAVVDEHSPDEIVGVDALVTTTPGLAVAVVVADCVPITLTSDEVVAVVHAGRRGVGAGIVGAAVATARALSATPLAAHLGPSICGACYEVPAPLQAEVCEVVPEARAVTRTGTPSLDLRAAVRAQLAAAGVTAITSDDACTVEDPAYFSHRRDGATGRFAMVAVLEP